MFCNPCLLAVLQWVLQVPQLTGCPAGTGGVQLLQQFIHRGGEIKDGHASRRAHVATPGQASQLHVGRHLPAPTERALSMRSRIAWEGLAIQDTRLPCITHDGIASHFHMLHWRF
jgi:hypothetical protein